VKGGWHGKTLARVRERDDDLVVAPETLARLEQRNQCAQDPGDIAAIDLIDDEHELSGVGAVKIEVLERVPVPESMFGLLDAQLRVKVFVGVREAFTEREPLEDSVDESVLDALTAAGENRADSFDKLFVA